MFEDSVFSITTIWASITGFLTPTVLFLLVNLVIATIFITSSLTLQNPNPNQNNDNHHHQQQQRRLHPQLVRSLSALKKLKSFTFNNTYTAQEPTTCLQKNPAENEEHFEQQQQQQEPNLVRSPSMLQKLKSIDFYRYLSPAQSQGQNFTNPEPTTEDHFDSGHIQWSESESEEEERRDRFEREVHGVGGGGHVTRSRSDTKPSGGEAPAKLSRRLKKSASAKSAFGHFKEDDDIVEIRRPETVREGKAKELAEKTEEEFDAKADDFITKFKEELKLQRLESVTRYKEMIERGAGQ